MLDTIFSLIGMDVSSFHIDHNILFIISSFFVFYCIGYMFNFFQTLMERLTAKK